MSISLLHLRITGTLSVWLGLLEIALKYSQCVDEQSFSAPKQTLVPFHYHTQTFPRVWFWKINPFMDHFKASGAGVISL